MDVFLLIRLISAHLVTDFLVQSNRGERQRQKKGWGSLWLYIHGALAGLLVYLFSAIWSAVWLAIAVAFTHVLTDGLKSRTKESVLSFALDQAAHVAVILVCWTLITGDYTLIILAGRKFHDAHWWIIVFSYVVVIWPAGIAVGSVTGRWRNDGKGKEASSTGVDGAGLLIGRLERFLILTFILLNHFEAIGFLIAAKSVFRFSELHSHAEYIIIGTMLSFSISLVIGLIVQYLLAIV